MTAADRHGDGFPVMCLHGWPGGASDYRMLRPLLANEAEVVVPHLPGFGRSFTPDDISRPPSDFDRDHMVAAVLELIEEMELESIVVVGYDIGANVAVALARSAPERVRAVVTGNLVGPSALALAALDAHRRSEFWYQDFHQMELSSRLIDGRPDSVRTYLEHFWSHWGTRPEAVVDEQLVADYARPGAFTTSLNWYRSGMSTLFAARAIAEGAPVPAPVSVPASVIWGADDPLFGVQFASTAAELLPEADITVHTGIGHFTPIEAAAEMAAAVRSHLP